MSRTISTMGLQLVVLAAMIAAASCGDAAQPGSSSEVTAGGDVTVGPPSPAATVIVPPPVLQPNFAFSFSAGACLTDTLDLFQGTYVKEINVGLFSTIPIGLTDVQLTAIYDKVIEVAFFSYPERFNVRVLEPGAPTTTYRLKVTNGESTKTVEWVDEIYGGDPGPKGQKLRELFGLIQGTIQADPDVKELPARQTVCV